MPPDQEISSKIFQKVQSLNVQNGLFSLTFSSPPPHRGVNCRKWSSLLKEIIYIGIMCGTQALSLVAGLLFFRDIFWSPTKLRPAAYVKQKKCPGYVENAPAIPIRRKNLTITDSSSASKSSPIGFIRIGLPIAAQQR